MGNQLAPPLQTGLRSSLVDLPHFVYQDEIGDSKVLKTMRCTRDNVQYVVKVYLRRPTEKSVGDDDKPLSEYVKRLKEIKLAFNIDDHPSVAPCQHFFVTDRAGFMVRQSFSKSLYERFHTPPFLTDIEKRWLIYQTLRAVAQAHGIGSKGITHGAINTDNLLVTSWDWVFLTDFAIHKPVYVPIDNPAEYNHFFDTQKNRRCYVAPERFVSHKSPERPATPVTKAMDVFSVGVTIAEIMLEGDMLFEHENLLKYIKEKYDPSSVLRKIEDTEVRGMIEHMIQLDPEARLDIKDYLRQWGPKIFPPYFEYLYDLMRKFVSSESYFDCDAKMFQVRKHLPAILKKTVGYSGAIPRSLRIVGASGHHSFREGDPHAVFTPSEEKMSLDVMLNQAERMSSSSGSKQKRSSKSKRSSSSRSELKRSILASASASAHVDPILGPEFHSNSNSSSKRSSVSAALASAAVNGAGKEVPRVNTHHFPSLPNQPIATQSPIEPFVEYSRVSSAQIEDSIKRLDAFVSRLKKLSKSEDIANFDEEGMSNILRSMSHSQEIILSRDLARPGERTSRSNSGVIIVLSLVCSCLRNVQYPRNKLVGIELLEALAPFVDDDVRVGRIVPYIMSMLTDSFGLVRATCVSAVANILDMVHSVIGKNTGMFSGYVLPALSSIPRDEEELVRLEYARQIARLASTARRFLDVAHFTNQASIRSGSIAIPPESMSRKKSKNKTTPVGRRSARTSSRSARNSISTSASSATEVSDSASSVSRTISVGSAAAIASAPLGRGRRAPRASSSDVSGSISRTDFLVPPSSNGSVASTSSVHSRSMSEGTGANPTSATSTSSTTMSMREALLAEAQETDFLPSDDGGNGAEANEGEAGDTASSALTRPRHSRGGGGDVAYRGKFDADLARLHDAIKRVVTEMLRDKSSSVKRALLSDITRLCVFFGRQQTSDFLLPLLITVLNDRDWQLRVAFFEHIAGVSVFVGRASVKAFIVPCIEQGLNDAEEFIVQRSLATFRALCDLELFGKEELLQVVQKVAPLLCHPSAWIRNSTLEFICSASRSLGPAKSHCFLTPLLRSFLDEEVVLINRDSLLAALKRPISWTIFNSYFAESLKHNSKLLPRFRYKRLRALPPEVLDEISRPTSKRESSLPESNPALSYSSSMPPLASTGGSGGAPASSATAHSSGTSPGRSSPSLSSTPGLNSQYSAPTWSPAGLAHHRSVSGGSDFYEEVDRQVELRMKHYIQEVTRTVESKVDNADSKSLAPEAAEELKQFDDLEHAIPLHSIFIAPTVTNSDRHYGGARYGDWKDMVLQNQATRQKKHGVVSAVHLKPQNRDTVNNPDRRTQSPHTALHQRPNKVSKVIRKALKIPPKPPNLGNIEELTLTTSPFYKNHRPPYAAERVEPIGWRPQGKLVAEFSGHSSCVNALAVSRDNAILASASNDGTVQLRDISRIDHLVYGENPILAYRRQGGRITDVTVCDSSRSVASSSDKGTVHVFRIERAQSLKVPSRSGDGSATPNEGSAGSGAPTVPTGGGAALSGLSVALNDARHAGTGNPAGGAGDKFGDVDGSSQQRSGLLGISNIQHVDISVEGPVLAVEHFNTLTESVLVYATRKGFVHGWDLRSRKEIWKFRVEPGVGLIETMVLGPNIYVLTVGTSRGFIIVWDLRFGVPIQIWRHSSKSRIVHLSPFEDNSMIAGSPLAQRVVHPTQGPLLFVSSEDTNEISAFDFVTGECRENFRVLASEKSQRQSLAGIFNKTSKPGDGTPAASPSLANSRTSVGNSSMASSSSQKRGTITRGAGARRTTTVSPLSLASLRSFPSMSVGPVLEFSTNGSHSSAKHGGASRASYTFPSAHEVQFMDSELQARCLAFGRSHKSITGFLCSKGNFGITVGTDSIVRYWDLREPHNSYRISSPPYEAHYQAHGENNAVVFDEVPDDSADDDAKHDSRSTSTSASSTLLKNRRGAVPPTTLHHDVITDLKAVEYPQRMLVTSSRDGAVKLWV